MTPKELLSNITKDVLFPKQTARPVAYPKVQISAEEYNNLIGIIQGLATINGESLLDGGNIDIKRQSLSFDLDEMDGCLYMEKINIDDASFVIDENGNLCVEK